MNKRLMKKRIKILNNRYNYIAKGRSFTVGRKNGKSKMLIQFVKACSSYEYAPFKKLMKLYER